MQLHAYYIAYEALFLAFSMLLLLKGRRETVEEGETGQHSGGGREDKGDVCAVNICSFPTVVPGRQSAVPG